MTRASKKLINSVAEILNRHIHTNSDVAGKLLKDKLVLQLIDEILEENAEGGRLVSAVESDGTVLGFVPRTAIPGATNVKYEKETEEIEAPPKSPEDADE